MGQDYVTFLALEVADTEKRFASEYVRSSDYLTFTGLVKT